MDGVNNQNSARAVPEPGSGRMTLLLIAGIPVIVILAASWMWYFVAKGQLDLVGALGTSNRGQLVQPPRQATEAGWSDAAGEQFAMGSSAKWSLVIPQRGANCETACERRLYEVRQIHMALGKELGRAQRLLVTDAALEDLTLNVEALSDQRPLPDDFATYVEREQRGMSLWHSGTDGFATMFPEYVEHPDSWYLMDPAGWVMMRYDQSVSYKDVISDLKFLMKNSNG
ncbi:hypothetical protein [Congregibacter litoralis]|uniref:Transmembrane protein n=1 Tax=Congregibacter litoralis KT71 TaxID=314285 RepID=A4A919_9GAMM|nr:hypothetical protein [Congregibacter litoralis]EAQ97561.1 hypothetical protein KT71_04610 [Congregibacter litoralis KT71]